MLEELITKLRERQSVHMKYRSLAFNKLAVLNDTFNKASDAERYTAADFEVLINDSNKKYYELEREILNIKRLLAKKKEIENAIDSNTKNN